MSNSETVQRALEYPRPCRWCGQLVGIVRDVEDVKLGRRRTVLLELDGGEGSFIIPDDGSEPRVDRDRRIPGRRLALHSCAARRDAAAAASTPMAVDPAVDLGGAA